MSSSRMSILNWRALPVTFLFITFSIVLAGRPLQKRTSSERIELNKTSLRQSGDCELACRACRFRLCEYDIYGDKIERRRNGAPLVLPRRSRVASFPWICLEEGSDAVGLVRVVDEVRVQGDDGDFVKISKFKPKGLGRKFAKRTLTSRALNAPPFPGCSGLAIQKSLRSDQQNALEGRCLILPIKVYEELRPDGSVKSVKKVRGEEDCVGFRAKSKPPVVKVELHWTNQDDMDLIVREPSNDVISYSSPESKSGGLLARDVTLGNCELTNQERDAMEYIEWSPEASTLRGQYEITVKHFSSCFKGALEWFLFVDVDGQNFFFETGVHALAGGDDNNNVEVDTFLIVLTS